MTETTPRIPPRITFVAGCLICIGIVFLNVAAQSPSGGESNAISISKEIFLWFMGATGFISLLIGIGYGFFKKQKYENLETDRDEWKDLAETRGERIKELKYTHTESDSRLKLEISNREIDIRNLRESNGALVSQSLQMKAILRDLRLTGAWQGHEERIHETQ
jgi:hypothetical protein